MIDELERPGPTRLRLRVPAPYGDAPGVVTVEVQLGEPPMPLDGCQILELVFSWGASADNGVVTVADAGGATLRLVDPNRLFDPLNTASSFAGIGTTVRILLNGITAFRGRVDDVQHDLTVATLALVDGVAALAGIQFVETSVPAESTAARISRILDLAAWPADRRDIGTGGRSLQAGTVSADAWSELLKVTRNELGALWLTPAGSVAWRNRTTAWLGGAPVMTFGCMPADAYIGTLTTRGDQSDLVNVLSAARRGGTQATRTDTTSLAIYGRHSHVQNDLELATDDERDLWSDFYIIRQANPALGVAGFDTRPASAALSKLLALPLGAIVRVYDEHHGPVIDRRARYVGAKWKVAPSYVEVDAVVGEDASIRQVARQVVIDTPAQWQAAAVSSTPIPNGSFEQDLAYWGQKPVGYTTATTPTYAAPNGVKVARIPGTANVLGYPGLQSSVVPVRPYETYRLRGWGKRELGTGLGLQIGMHTCSVSGALITAHVIDIDWNPYDPLDTGGAYKEKFWQCPNGVAYVLVEAYLNHPGPGTDHQWLVDDITLDHIANVAYREPGIAPRVLPAPLAGPYLTRDERRDELLEDLEDASRPTPSGPGEPKRKRGRPRKAT